MASDEPVAYVFEVNGPLSNGWSKHVFLAEELPDGPAETWREDHEVRNVRALGYIEGDVRGSDGGDA